MSAYRGFTLIELLVAVSLATIITLLGVSLMRTSINGSVSNEEALIQSQAVRDVQRLIELAWSGRQSHRFGAGVSQIEFISSQKAFASVPLRFVCQAGEKDDYALWFYRASSPAQPGQAGEPPDESSGEKLLGDLRLCQFGFLQAPQDDQQPAQWKQEWPAGKVPPTLIRLDLATLHGTLPPLIFAAGGP